MSPLHCILCGFAQGGTTILSQFVRQHPRIDGRFEIGFLLAESPGDFARLPAKYHQQILRHWGISDADLWQICSTPTFQEAYKELLERSDLPDKSVRIYDKKPRYMSQLPDVMERCSVPAVVIVRDPRAVFWSRSKHEHRGRPTVKQLAKAYIGTGRRCRRAVECFSKHILVVQHEELCMQPDREGRRIFEHLELEWQPHYARLEDRLVKIGKEKLRPGLSTDATIEYREYLDDDVQRELLVRTAEFSEWHWTPPQLSERSTKSKALHTAGYPSRLSRITAPLRAAARGPRWILRNLRRVLLSVRQQGTKMKNSASKTIVIFDLDFVLITHQRSGSHLLMDLLDSHPEVKTYGEVVRSGIEPKPLAGKKIGAIVHYNQWERAMGRIDLFVTKVVHLKRKPMEVATSVVRNRIDREIRGERHQAHYKAGEERPYHGKVDLGEVHRWRDKVDHLQRQFSEFLSDHDVYTLTYEELTAGVEITEAPEPVMGPLLEFLGVDCDVPLKTDFLKVAPPSVFSRRHRLFNLFFKLFSVMT